MKYWLYADESGTHPLARCYTIGAILVPETEKARFRDDLNQLRQKHRISSEVKWENVRNSYNLMNFAMDLLKRLLCGPCAFRCIVVHKREYRKWRNNEEEAFYTTYTLLIENCTKRLAAELYAYIDQKSDSYDKHHEVVGIIANYKLRGYLGQVEDVVRGNSADYIELQAVDLITGAINAAHDLYLNPRAPVNAGKRLLLSRLSNIVGWDNLHYDTFPDTEFNIWHFPMDEYRGVPQTRDLQPNLNVPYVTPNDIDALAA